METVLIKCPHCKEQMQAPTGRESILCMFCGEKIDLRETDVIQPDVEADLKKPAGKAKDAGKCYENLNFVLEHAGAACRDYSAKVRAFRKDSYHELFERYKEENYAFYPAIKLVLDNAPDDAESFDGICHQIAGGFIRTQEAELEQVKKKNEKFTVQMDKNMFMAVYVLPSVKEIGGTRADELAEAICKEWGKSFKDSNIIASDYDSIVKGFKRKLCYVTTAVCQNLNKGEDCEELRLIKEFRDGYLSATKEGQALIGEYYDIAPTLVKRIAKDAEAEAKYIWLWDHYLAPCVAFIRAGAQEECKETYCEMMEELRKEYMPVRKK